MQTEQAFAMLYPGSIGIVVGSSQSGKTSYVLSALRAANVGHMTGAKRVIIYTFEGDRQFDGASDTLALPTEVRYYGKSYRTRGSREDEQTPENGGGVKEKQVGGEEEKEEVEVEEEEEEEEDGVDEEVEEEEEEEEEDVMDEELEEVEEEDGVDEMVGKDGVDEELEEEGGEGTEGKTDDAKASGKNCCGQGEEREQEYHEFDPDDIPGNTICVFDEVSQRVLLEQGRDRQAQQRRPRGTSFIQGLKILMTTKAHHKNISVIGIVQHLVGTPSSSLLPLAHYVVMNPLQNSSLAVLPYFPIVKSVYAKMQHILLRLQAAMNKSKRGSCMATIYYNPPWQYKILSNCIAIRADDDILFVIPVMAVAGEDRAASADMLYSLSKDANAVLGPLLDEGLSGLIILPSSQVLLNGEATEGRQSAGGGESTKTTEAGNERQQLEDAFNQMIRYTVANRQQWTKYRKVWYFIRNSDKLTIDPVTLVMADNDNYYCMHLNQYISTVLRPSHLVAASAARAGTSSAAANRPNLCGPTRLRNNLEYMPDDEEERYSVARYEAARVAKAKKRSRTPPFSLDALGITAILLRSSGFDPSIITNTELLQAALEVNGQESDHEEEESEKPKRKSAGKRTSVKKRV